MASAMAAASVAAAEEDEGTAVGIASLIDVVHRQGLRLPPGVEPMLRAADRAAARASSAGASASVDVGVRGADARTPTQDDALLARERAPWLPRPHPLAWAVPRRFGGGALLAPSEILDLHRRMRRAQMRAPRAAVVVEDGEHTRSLHLSAAIGAGSAPDCPPARVLAVFPLDTSPSVLRNLHRTPPARLLLLRRPPAGAPASRGPDVVRVDIASPVYSYHPETGAAAQGGPALASASTAGSTNSYVPSTASDLSASSLHGVRLVALEYMEEHPTAMLAPGMGARLVTF